jgi:hypothetical protein
MMESFTKYFVYWTPVPGVISDTPKPEGREYTSRQWAEKRAEAQFPGWEAKMLTVTAPSESECDEVIEEVRRAE